MQNNYPDSFGMGKKNDNFDDELHGDLPYSYDPIYDPYAPNVFQNEKREADDTDDIPYVGDPAIKPDGEPEIDLPEDPPTPNRAWTL